VKLRSLQLNQTFSYKYYLGSMEWQPKIKVIIIGGGAAGFFAANEIVAQSNLFDITILEQGQKVLQKVKVSGGGRCNVTNAVILRENLADYYPRGWKLLRKLFSNFDHLDTVSWFEKKSIALKKEADNRMFPVTNDSQTIVDGLRSVAQQSNVRVFTSCKVLDFEYVANQWKVHTNSNGQIKGDVLLIASGSSTFIYDLLQTKGVKIVPPVPSLFTFNIPNDIRLTDLSGIAVPLGRARIVGEKLVSLGPVLITHWGLSGPAILKLSSWEAVKLAGCQYHFKVAINWVNMDYEECKHQLLRIQSDHQNKKVSADAAFNVPKRLWKKLLDFSQIPEDQIWKGLSKKQVNVLLEQLTNSVFEVNGKSTFKEEFVTCGGVDLNEVDSKTLQHKTLPNLFFAGEVLDIDAITGGYNFQAAWTTAFVAAQSIVDFEKVDLK
jgi:predicted Rossmann fold flavoprotein